MTHGINDRAAPPRTALTLDEAAESIGVSLPHFRRHVLPIIGTVKCGTLTLIPLAEIERWLDASKVAA